MEDLPERQPIEGMEELGVNEFGSVYQIKDFIYIQLNITYSDNDNPLQIRMDLDLFSKIENARRAMNINSVQEFFHTEIMSRIEKLASEFNNQNGDETLLWGTGPWQEGYEYEPD